MKILEAKTCLKPRPATIGIGTGIGPVNARCEVIVEGTGKPDGLTLHTFLILGFILGWKGPWMRHRI
jgi:hypothetical protein